MDQTQAIKFWDNRINQLDDELAKLDEKRKAIRARRRKAVAAKKAVEDELGAFPEIAVEGSGE